MVSGMTRVGLIARMDKSGLGQGQTLRLARLLNPARLMVIDSSSFNGAVQYPEWYAEYASFDSLLIDGFPTEEQIRRFLSNIDVVISCETFYNNYFVEIAQANKTKTILIANYEFLDYHRPDYHHPLPDKLVFPSQWMMDTMNDKAIYLPTPIFDDEFKKAREVNLKRTGKPRYLFLNGKSAAHDRAGLTSLYEAMELSKGDFEVVVKAQGEIKKHPDPRLTYDFSNPDEQWKLYAGFDAMILPRRYAGQALNCNEALMSGLPVIMTRISPNTMLLPDEWLVDATKTGEFMARTMIDIYSAIPQDLADTIDSFASLNHFVNTKNKELALEIGKQYDAETLRPEYERVISSLL